MIIYLSNGDIAEVREVAERLAKKWKGQINRTLGGLKAECAAVKYFNYTLGANPYIKFNTLYNENGGDGGFDFRFPHWLKWDVKSTFGASLVQRKHLRTKADCIMLVRRVGINAFRMVGYCPVSRLPEKKYLTDDIFHSMYDISRTYPDNFSNPKVLITEPKKQQRPERAGTIINRLINRAKRENLLKEQEAAA